jgi:hypothetical protein
VKRGMSLLEDSGHDDQQLARYLLGLLPDEDAERLDEASIADDEVAAWLRVVEDGLVDAYASGNLAGELLERFESVYLSSPRRRQKVRLAARLLRTVDRAVAPADVSSHRFSPKLRLVPPSTVEHTSWSSNSTISVRPMQKPSKNWRGFVRRWLRSRSVRG